MIVAAAHIPFLDDYADALTRLITQNALRSCQIKAGNDRSIEGAIGFVAAVYKRRMRLFTRFVLPPPPPPLLTLLLLLPNGRSIIVGNRVEEDVEFCAIRSKRPNVLK